jgi:hypothetical protein
MITEIRLKTEKARWGGIRARTGLHPGLVPRRVPLGAFTPRSLVNRGKKSTLLARYRADRVGVTGLLRLHIESGDTPAGREARVTGLEMLQQEGECVTADAVGGVAVVPPGEWYPILGYGIGEARMTKGRLKLQTPSTGLTRPLSLGLSWTPGFVGNGPCRSHYSWVDTVFGCVHRDSFPPEAEEFIGIWGSSQATGAFTKSAAITVEPIEPRVLSLGAGLLVLLIYPLWVGIVLGLGPFYAAFWVFTCGGRFRWVNQTGPGKAYRRAEPLQDWNGRAGVSRQGRPPRLADTAYAKLVSAHIANQEDPLRGSPRSATARTWNPSPEREVQQQGPGAEQGAPPTYEGQ